MFWELRDVSVEHKVDERIASKQVESVFTISMSLLLSMLKLKSWSRMEIEFAESNSLLPCRC